MDSNYVLIYYDYVHTMIAIPATKSYIETNLQPPPPPHHQSAEVRSWPMVVIVLQYQ